MGVTGERPDLEFTHVVVCPDCHGEIAAGTVHDCPVRWMDKWRGRQLAGAFGRLPVEEQAEAKLEAVCRWVQADIPCGLLGYTMPSACPVCCGDLQVCGRVPYMVIECPTCGLVARP